MKKLLSSLLIALTVLITASPVRADGESISSVTVVGATEQSGTPTPNTPVDIVSNNGVVKVNRNLYSTEYHDKALSRSDGVIASTLAGVNVSAMVNCTNVKSFMVTSANPKGSFRLFKYRPDGTFIDAQTTGVLIGQVLVLPSDCGYFRIQYNYTSEGVGTENILIYNSDYGLNEIYTDGTVETITDSANHTATVATLLGVGDYRDTQNINTGAITRNVGVKVLNGTENWRWQNYLNHYFTISTAQSDMPGSSSGLPGYSNMFSVVDSASAGADNTIRLAYARFSIRYDTANGDVNAFKQFLAAQYAAGTPVIIVYPLATATTESVAGQTMTTAPVNNRTGGVTGMTITTLLSSGASVVTTIATNAIKIATTAYNAARFSPVKTDLNNAVATIREIVTKTINQTAAIASLQADKQTRPEEQCPAGKKCLLVETEENGVIVPHWFPIIENIYGLPAGYTALEYIESTGTQYIDTGFIANGGMILDAKVLPVNKQMMLGSIGPSDISPDTTRNMIAYTSSGVYSPQKLDIYYSASYYADAGTSPAVIHFDTTGTKFYCTVNGNVAVNTTTTDILQNLTTTVKISYSDYSSATRSGRYYYVKITAADGNVVRDFVPAKRNSDNVIGMYDLVNDVFYTNSGTGTFTAGPEI